MAGTSVGVTAADRLCSACVEFLQVDGAAISVLHGGASQGTFGASSELSRRLDEFQFTYGEGPCLDAVAVGHPVLVADLEHEAGRRWPAYSAAMSDAGIRGVFALPVVLSTTLVGVLDLFRHRPGSLSGESLTGGLLAAKLAASPLLERMSDQIDDGTTQTLQKECRWSA